VRALKKDLAKISSDVQEEKEYRMNKADQDLWIGQRIQRLQGNIKKLETNESLFEVISDMRDKEKADTRQKHQHFKQIFSKQAKD